MTALSTTGLRRAVLALAVVLGGPALATGAAQAAPLAAPPVEAVASDAGITTVQWGHRHHHHHGHWGHRGHHFGHHHHHRRHWGHRGHHYGHHHHHHHRYGGRHFY